MPSDMHADRRAIGISVRCIDLSMHSSDLYSELSSLRCSTGRHMHISMKLYIVRRCRNPRYVVFLSSMSRVTNIIEQPTCIVTDSEFDREKRSDVKRCYVIGETMLLLSRSNLLSVGCNRNYFLYVVSIETSRRANRTELRRNNKKGATLVYPVLPFISKEKVAWVALKRPSSTDWLISRTWIFSTKRRPTILAVIACLRFMNKVLESPSKMDWKMESNRKVKTSVFFNPARRKVVSFECLPN